VIPNDSGGGGGFTVWEAFDIEAMHNMVESVDDAQIEASWNQVAAWRKTHELLDSHAGKLITYRQGLIERWPPEKNAAAAVFVKHVDDLVQSLQQSSAAANSNYLALADLTGEVMTARKKVQDAYREYKANQGKLDEYQQAVDAYKADTTGLPQPSPGPSPVPPQRQQQLVNDARKAMAALSGVAIHSSTEMRIPPPYTPPTAAVVEQKREEIGAPPAVMMQPPVIPAPRTSPAQSGSTAPNLPFPAGTTNAPGGRGPTLTGGVLHPPPPAPTPAPPVPNPGLPGGGPPIGAPGLPPAYIGNVPPGKSAGPRGESPGVRPGQGPGGSVYRPAGEGGPTGRGAGAARPLPPGGVIGGVPAGGMAGHPGAMGTGTAAARRVNPVGGVLGQGAHAGGTGGTTTGQPYLAGRAAGRGDRDRDSRSWDPDNPWAVEHGVTPVLEPGQEPSSHDPGPGVIGIDR
jgi:hypothetical protein